MDTFKLNEAQLEQLQFSENDGLVFADMELEKLGFLTEAKTKTVLEGKDTATKKIVRVGYNTLNEVLEEFVISEKVNLDLPILGEINFAAINHFARVIFSEDENTWQEGYSGMLKKESGSTTIFNTPLILEKLDDDKYAVTVDWSLGAAPNLGALAGLLMPDGKPSDLMKEGTPASLQKAVVLSELSFLLAPKATEPKGKIETVSAEFLFNATDNWVLFENIKWLDISNLNGKIKVQKPLFPIARTVEIEVGGSLLLGAAGSQAEVKITATNGENFSITGELQEGNPIPLGDILERIGLPILGPASGDDKLIISALSFEAQPKEGTYSFNKIRVENILKFQVASKELFSLQSLEASLAVTKEAEIFSTAATIDAEMDLLGQEITASISGEGSDEADAEGKKVNPFTWKLEANAKKINVFKMVQRLLSTPSHPFSLPQSLSALDLTDAKMNLDIASGDFLLKGKFKKLWSIGGIDLKDVDFYFHYNQTDGFEVKFTATVAIGDADTGTEVKVEFVYNDGAWILDGNTTKALALQKIANSITGSKKYVLPSPLKTVSISHLGVHLEKTATEFVFSTTATVLLTDFPIKNKTSEIILVLELVKNNDSSKSLNIGGQMTVTDDADEDAAPHLFKINFSKDDSSNALLASYQGHFPLVKIIELFENDTSPNVSSLIPNWFSPTVIGATFLLLTNNDPQKDSTVLFNMDLTMGEINLKDMDLVGAYIGDFPIVPKVAISVCTAMLDAQEIIDLNKILLEIQGGSNPDNLIIVADGKDAAQNDVKLKGFMATLSLNDLEVNGLPNPAGKLAALMGDISKRSFSFKKLFTPTGDQPAEEAAEEKTKWSSTRKNYGPLFVNKMGVSLDDGKFNLLLDGGLNMGGFTFSLMNLGVKVPLQMPFDVSEIEFGLDGLAINYVNGGLKIAGAFLAQKVAYEGNICNGYFGEIQLKVGDKSFKAIGCYIHPKAGQLDRKGNQLAPSFFLFAAVNIPIGGPAFFFVTGFAAGFGINSSLNIPSIDNLRDFVLLKISFDEMQFDESDPGANIKKIQQDIFPKLDSYWMAVGIKARHFSVVESFFLLTVEFGNRLEINLMGIMRIVLPPPGNLIVKAELAVRARFLPEEGILSIEGRVSPGSYILNPLAKLGGGFAFMIWMKEHGSIKVGDFVLSLGGYHPQFKPPSHYPAVPRLSLSWQLNAEIFIKGEMYFAITPNVLMAGGRLEARADMGFIQAWFIAEAHFLVNFSPFFYNATISVSMGAKVTLDLWLVTVTKSFSFSARLELWGPNFGGHAVIDLSIVEFEISFGASKAPPPPLKWEQYQKDFLPAANEIIVTSIGEGLIKDLKGNPAYGDTNYVLNPTEMKLIVETAVPITKFILSKNEAVNTGQNTVGVLVMNLSKGQLESTVQLDIVNELGKSQLYDDEVNFLVTVNPNSNVPVALWGGGEDRGNMNATKKLIENVSKSFAIIPKQKDEIDFDSLPKRDIASLAYEAPELSHLVFGFVPSPRHDDFDSKKYTRKNVTSTTQEILDLLNDGYELENFDSITPWIMTEDDWQLMESSTTFSPTGVL